VQNNGRIEESHPMDNVENKLQEIVNAGIGAVKTSKEVWDKLVVDLNEKKTQFEQNFQKLKEQGESDTSDKALKVKMGVAWGIVRFDEMKDNLIQYLNKDKKDKPSS
jgi:hypothetical protein